MKCMYRTSEPSAGDEENSSNRHWDYKSAHFDLLRSRPLDEPERIRVSISEHWFCEGGNMYGEKRKEEREKIQRATGF